MKKEKNSEAARKGKEERQNATNEGFTATRKRLMEALLDPDTRRMSVSALCGRLRIDRSTYYRAMDDKDFREEYQRRSRDLVQHAVGPVVNALVDQAKMGNTQAMRIVLEMAGLYIEKKEVSTPPGRPFEIDAMKALSVEALERLAG